MATAIKSTLAYGDETVAFGTKSTSINKTFGHGEKITTLNRKNNAEKVYGLGNREAQEIPYKQFEGNLGIDFVLANPWWLENACGSLSSGGSGPTTHTFTEGNTLPSFTTLNDIDLATDVVVHFLGCQINAFTLSAAVNELVNVSLDIQYANEVKSTTPIGDTNETFDLFTFAQGSVDLPSGSTMAKVQNIELSYNNNLEMVRGLGSRVAQEGPVKNLDISATTSLAFQDSTYLELFYGSGSATGPEDTPTQPATLILVFTNGEAGADERSITFNFGPVTIDEETLPQDPTALYMEGLTLQVQSLTSVVAINSTAARP